MELAAITQRGCLTITLVLVLVLVLISSTLAFANTDWQIGAATNTNGSHADLTNCDSLFMSSDNLANYCQCQDAEIEADASARVPPTDSAAINQLTCRPSSLAQFIADLAAPTMNRRIQVDYLSLSTNLSRELTRKADTSGKGNKLRVGHMSIQLGISPIDTAHHLVQEMITDQVAGAFVGHLIDEAHLQFLTIFLVELEDSRDWSSSSGKQQQQQGCGGLRSELRLARLLGPLVNLNRLELNFGGRALVCSLRLESQMFAKMAKLKWLSLSSIGGVNFDEISPFGGAALATLEHMSFESSNLAKFPLHSLLAPPESLANLTSLNLASNKLASLEDDLFFHLDHGCASERQQKALLALNQLDLSHNSLQGLTFREAQLLICTMPNLSQLFLQHNRIAHLNLNSLLTFPFVEPASIYRHIINSDVAERRASKLEYLDLSHNRLSKITGFQSDDHTFQVSSHIKSINLANNRMQRPISSFESHLIGKILFKESFEHLTGRTNNSAFSLDSLEDSFSLEHANPANLCDYLSHRTAKQTGDSLLNEVILSGNELTGVLLKDFSSKQCRDVQILQLSSNRIGSIERGALNHLVSLEHLDLSKNLLITLAPETFVANVALRVVSLSENRITSLSRDLFLNLVQLQELLLDNNELYEVPFDLFAHNNRIEIIDLSRNELTHLDESSFYNLQHLRLLNLNHNKLKEFNGHLFKLANGGTKQIPLPRVVDSSSNNMSIKHLDMVKVSTKQTSNKFHHQKSQKNIAKRKHSRRQAAEGNNILILASNKIQSVHFDTPECSLYIQNVQSLKLNDNQLTELQGSSLSCFRSVQKLYLQSNRIKHIDSSALNKMSQLECIDLSKNLIKSIDKGVFAHSNYLQYLNLNENRLTSLKLTDMFGPSREIYPQLGSLNLGDNFGLQIRTQDLIAFIMKTSPRQINLGYVRLIGHDEEWNKTSSKEKFYLDTLNLSSVNSDSDSLVQFLSDQTFVGIDKLELSGADAQPTKKALYARLAIKRLQNDLTHLNLAGNQYTNQDFASISTNLSDQVQLSSLNLSSNQLEHWPFDSGQMARKFSRLKSLDLCFNRMRHFVHNDSTSYEFPEMESLNLSHNAIMNLVEHPKQRVKSLKALMPRLVGLDLSHNRLTWIPYIFFDELTDLTWLKLDHNQLETFSSIVPGHHLYLDLSSNPQFQSMTHPASPQRSYAIDYVDLGDLIITYSNQQGLIRCQPIRDYKSASLGRQGINELDDEVIALRSDIQEGDRTDEERCKRIVSQTNSVILNSVSSRANLNTIRISDGKGYTHLSLRNNGLTQIQQTGGTNKNVISLDLAHNQLQTVPASTCQTIGHLRSLDLSNNQFTELPELLFSCKKITYLDLSHNQISHWLKNDSSHSTEKSSIVVLKLAFNVLTDLHNFDLISFESLQVIDLTSNRLKFNQFVPLTRSAKLLTVLPFIKVEQDPVALDKPSLSLTDDALLVNWTSGDYTLTIAQADAEGPSEQTPLDIYENSKGFVKFCTLNTTAKMTRVCLKSKLDHQDAAATKCFHMQLPANVSSCLSKLQEPPETNNQLTQTSFDPSHLASNIDQPSIEADPVLSFIDFLKRNWIRLKEMDLNAYLTSLGNIKTDSVIQIDGKNSIYTVTAIKLAIVGCAICIVILLLTLFTFFTWIGANQRSSCASPKSDSQMTSITTTTDGSTGTDDSRTKSTNSDTSALQTQLSLSCNSRSRSDTSKEDTAQLPTVMERKTSLQIDPNQLMHLQQQVCTTPSSSIAPSSVETAETLQAIDSIQSGTITDHYTDSSINSNTHGQNQQHLATVMRMVKSSSANFDSSNQHSAFNSSCGTTNAKSNNYSTLKSKMRTIYEQQQHNRMMPSSLYKQYSASSVHYDIRDRANSNYNHAPDTPSVFSANNGDQTYQHDPTTISLISINRALANNNHDTYADHQTIPLSSLEEHNSGLCHYHRLSKEPVGSTTHQNVIMEQEEEQQYQQNNDLTFLGEFPAPPPPSRAIQALESSLQQVPNQISSSHTYFPI